MKPNREEIVKRIQREIILDMLDERVPLTVRCFAELHDYVDANEYGGFCDEVLVEAWIAFYGGRDEDEGMPQPFMDLMNAVQEDVGKWLAQGACLRDMLAYARAGSVFKPGSWQDAVRLGMEVRA